MRFIDIAIGVLAIGLVLFTILYNLRKKRRGESGCAYCSGCAPKKGPGAHCSGAQNVREKDGTSRG